MLSDLQAMFKGGKVAPHLIDPSTGVPSLSYMLAYISGMSAIISAILHLADKVSLWSSINMSCLFVVCMVFYRMGKLDKFKVDLDDRTLELDAEDQNGEKG